MQYIFIDTSKTSSLSSHHPLPPPFQKRNEHRRCLQASKSQKKLFPSEIHPFGKKNGALFGWKNLRLQEKNKWGVCNLKMIGTNVAHSHIPYSQFSEKKGLHYACLACDGWKIPHLLRGRSRIPLFTSGSSTHPPAIPHWNLFLPSTQTSNFIYNINVISMRKFHHNLKENMFFSNLIYIYIYEYIYIYIYMMLS